jgi:hypothetical protein
MAKSTYTYDLKSDRGSIIAQFDVEFEYEIEDDGTDMPFVEVTAVYVEGNEDLLRDRGLSGKLGFDIRQQIHDDKQFCDQLMEGTDHEFTAYDSNRSALHGLRTVRGASLVAAE